MRSVKFSDKVDIININSNRNIPNYNVHINNFLKIVDNTYIQLINIINNYSPHKIVFTNNEEIPIKIYSIDKIWYQDDTILILYERLMSGLYFLIQFINEYNENVVKYIDNNKSGSIEYYSKLCNIYIKIMGVIRN